MKIKKVTSFVLIFIIWFFCISSAYGLSINISWVTSTWTWSNNSIITFWKSPNELNYVSIWDNSEIIWNYFEWYYYDRNFWYFKLNWSEDKTKNVKISWITNKCSWSYWYKLSWKAYSENIWYIDFAYNNSTFVYYCMDTKTLHWYAYSDIIWKQNFEWIWFNIVINWGISTNSNNDLFVNDSSMILFLNSDDLTQKQKKSINFWEKSSLEYWEERIFYIFKPKK